MPNRWETDVVSPVMVQLSAWRQPSDLVAGMCVCSQKRLTLCDPVDHILPGSSVHGISWQEYWSGLPFPPAGDLLNTGIKPASPALQVGSLLLSH